MSWSQSRRRVVEGSSRGQEGRGGAGAGKVPGEMSMSEVSAGAGDARGEVDGAASSWSPESRPKVAARCSRGAGGGR